MRITKHIPNLLTCCNLICGCLGIVAALSADFETVLWLVLLASFFDFLDGLAARALNAYSVIGKDLDSLADCVTFGVLPAMVVFAHTFRQSGQDMHANMYGCWPAYLGFTIAVGAALRLAIFNNDTRQTDRFIGLPSPANGLFFAGIAYLIGPETDFGFASHYTFLPVLSVIFAFLMLCSLPLFSFKIKSFRINKYPFQFLLLFFSIIFVLYTGLKSVCFIVVLYIFFSVLDLWLKKKDLLSK